MAPKFNYVQREYSPAEVAIITGVSTALQRDWRRRGILPCTGNPGWHSFYLTDVIDIFILKWASDTGFFVKQKMDVLRLNGAKAGEPIWQHLLNMDGVGEIHSDHPEAKKYFDNFLGSALLGSTRIRYLVILSCDREDEGRVEHVEFTEDLSSIEQKIEEFGSIGFTALDLLKVGDLIAERGGLPIYRVEADE